MTEKFEIGEIAVIKKFEDDPSIDGRECTVESAPTFFDMPWVGVYGHYHRISIPGLGISGEQYFAKPEHLRKKKPPQREIDQVTTWDKCAWRPRELQHA